MDMMSPRASPHASVPPRSARGTGGTWPVSGRTLSGQTAGRLVIGQTKHSWSGQGLTSRTGSDVGAVEPEVGERSLGAALRLPLTSSAPMSPNHTCFPEAPKAPSGAKIGRLANIGASSLVSKPLPFAAVAPAVATKREADHRQLEACYGTNVAAQDSQKCSPRPWVANMNRSGKQSQGTPSSRDSADTQLHFGPIRSDSEPGHKNGTHHVLEAALLGKDGLTSSDEASNPGKVDSSTHYKAPLADGRATHVAALERARHHLPEAMVTQPLPATGSVQTSNDFGAPHVSSKWDSTLGDLEKEGAKFSSCEFLEQELSAIHSASVEQAEYFEKASAAGFTCDLLAAELRSNGSWAEGPADADLSPSHGSALQLSEEACCHFVSESGGTIFKCKDATRQSRTPGQAAEREVERLCQVLDSYERQVVPHLMVERAMLNCQLAKAREAAVASEIDCQALRGRIAEAEAESDVLRSQLDAARTAVGRRGGG